jgi:tRNA pseudouridine32 synthase/23S rRNA pseudouridine746 synthase
MTFKSLRACNSSGRAIFMWENRVLFIDGEALILDKPAGLAVHPGSRTRESLADYLHHLRFGFQRAPVPVHRLDRDTSGCLLLARNPKALRRFQRAFEERCVEKSYVAILDGLIEGDEGMIDLPLAKISSAEDGWKMVVDSGGQSAITAWRRLEVSNGRTLVGFTPATGRTHQLRAHALYGLGVPIKGDPRYGTSAGPMLLHALSIRVDREAKPPVAASAPLPQIFSDEGFGDVRR